MRTVLFSSLLGLGMMGAYAPVASAQIAGATANYSWTSGYEASNTLVNRIAPPVGYTRTSCKDGSYCSWVRNLPLKPQGTPVYFYDGNQKVGANAHAVIDMDVGAKDLQQCADAVMRLKAEYHFSRKDYSNIHFNFTSGHKVSFDDWRRGKKPIVHGNKVRFTKPKQSTDNSYSNFQKYMTIIFSYAGTLSLEKELRPVAIDNVRVGDVFIYGGSPGHAVMVMDVAKNAEGKKMFLLAQSYTPAQDMHILTNPFHPGEGPWYSTEYDRSGPIFTPEWTFKTSELRRFRN